MGARTPDGARSPSRATPASAPLPKTIGVTGWRWTGPARGEEARAGSGRAG